MIGKITKGADFASIFAGVLNENTEFTILPEAQQCFSSTPKNLASEFQYVANFRHRITSPARHYSISFAPEDGAIDNEIKAEIAVRIMTEMGFGDSQYLGVAHSRNNPNHHQLHEHDCIHIIANTIKPNGEKVSDFWDYRRMEKCLRNIEIEYGFRQLINSWERHKADDGVQSVELQGKIDRTLSDSPSLGKWIDRLESSGIHLKFRITSKGQVQGINYIYQGKISKGSNINRGWGLLSSRFEQTPENLELMKSATLKAQSLPIELQAEDYDLLAKTADLAMQKLAGKDRLKNQSVIISIVDDILMVQRLRPNKIILSAKRDIDGKWQSIGVPNIDPKKDLHILET